MIVKIATERGAISLELPSVIKGDETYCVCPLCTPGREERHKKEKKLSVNLIKGCWRCNHCGKSGYIIDESKMSKFTGKPYFIDRQLPIDVVDNESAFLWKWLTEERKISETIAKWLGIYITIRPMKLKNVPDKFEQWRDTFYNQHVFAFPYIMDGAAVNCQYRDSWKNFSMERDADKIMYNIDSVKGKSKVIITEGMIDVASIYTDLGIESEWAVISVPNGATITDAEKEVFEKTGDIEVFNEINLDYFTSSIERFSKIEEFCFAGDVDAAGIKLRKSIQRIVSALPDKLFSVVNWSSVKFEDGKPCKDSNDVLKVGPTMIKSCIERRKFVGSEIIRRALDTLPEIFSIYYNGLTKALKPKYGRFDDHFGIKPGDLIVGTGWPGSGKTIFTLNLTVIYSFHYNWKWGIWMPENYPISLLYSTIAEIYAGRSMDRNSSIAFTQSQLEKSMEWVHDHFFIVDMDAKKAFTPVDIRNKMNRMISMYNINGFVIDPWNSLIEDETYFKLGGHKWLENQLTLINAMSKQYGVTTIIMVHPITQEKQGRKGNDDGTFRHPTMYEADGGKIWSAKCDVFFTVHRPYSDFSDTSSDVYVQKLKTWKLYGIPTGENNPVRFNMEPSSNRFYINGTFPLSEVVTDISYEIQNEIEF